MYYISMDLTLELIIILILFIYKNIHDRLVANAPSL